MRTCILPPWPTHPRWRMPSAEGFAPANCTKAVASADLVPNQRLLADMEDAAQARTRSLTLKVQALGDHLGQYLPSLRQDISKVVQDSAQRTRKKLGMLSHIDASLMDTAIQQIKHEVSSLVSAAPNPHSRTESMTSKERSAASQELVTPLHELVHELSSSLCDSDEFQRELSMRPSQCLSKHVLQSFDFEAAASPPAYSGPDLLATYGSGPLDSPRLANRLPQRTMRPRTLARHASGSLSPPSTPLPPASHGEPGPGFGAGPGAGRSSLSTERSGATADYALQSELEIILDGEETLVDVS